MGSGRSIGIAIGLDNMQTEFGQFDSEIKAKENEERIFAELLNNAENGKNITGSDAAIESPFEQTKEEKYIATEELRNHIEKPDPPYNRTSGIKGAHNKKNFMNEVERVGARITSTKPNSQMPGVEKIKYQMLSKDLTGKVTGEYRSHEFSKTVYDPEIISTNSYIERGLQAANNAAKETSSGSLGREWRGKDNRGVMWHGYCDEKGKITSFYPED